RMRRPGGITDASAAQESADAAYAQVGVDDRWRAGLSLLCQALPAARRSLACLALCTVSAPPALARPGASSSPGCKRIPEVAPPGSWLLAEAAVLAPVAPVFAAVAPVVAAVLAPVASTVYAVGDYRGTADGGNGSPAASGCQWHVRLLPRR